MNQFKFKLEDSVRHISSNLYGIVISRVEHIFGENCYQVQYLLTDGTIKMDWIPEKALTL